MPTDASRLPLPNPQVIHRSLPDGAVLFSTADEVYFGLNAVASRVWELLPPALGTIGELCLTLQAEYPDAPPATIRADVAELLEHLEVNGLTAPAPAPAPARVLHADANVPALLEAAPAPALGAG